MFVLSPFKKIRLQAYHDRPFRNGNIHISAPHMYVTVLEALEIQPGMSFLNVGSGSGYLSCLAAYMLGEGGLSHGIEVAEGMASYSTAAVKRWHKKNSEAENSSTFSINLDSIKFVAGNGFDINLANTVSTCRYDRIYIGAGCPDKRKDFFLSMLSDDGVMVVPINEKNEMVKIKKFCGSIYNQTHISDVHFAPMVETHVRSDEAAHIREAHQIQLREQRSRSGSLLSEGQMPPTASTDMGLVSWRVGELDPSEEAIEHLESEAAFSVLSVEGSVGGSSFIVHPAMSIHRQISDGRHGELQTHSPAGQEQNSALAATATTTMDPTQQQGCLPRICLPPLVWAPSPHRHCQFPREFRRAVFTILLANQRTTSHVPYMKNGSSSSSSSSSSCGGVAKLSGTCFLPQQLWLYVFSFANRYPLQSSFCLGSFLLS